VFGGVEHSLDDLIRKAALSRDGLACPVEQCPRVPCDQLDEQIVAVSEVTVDVGPRQSNLGGNVVHRGLADSVTIDAAFSGGQDALDGKSGIGEVGQRLDRPQASPPEDADFQPRQTVGDQPEAAEHQQVGESEGEGR